MHTIIICQRCSRLLCSSRTDFFYSQSTYQQISEIATSLTVKQVKAIMGYLEWQEKYHMRVMGVSSMLPDAELEAIQGTYLRLLNLLYELGSRAMRDE